MTPDACRRSVLLALAGLPLSMAACQRKPVTVLERIRQTMILKVGLQGDHPPFSVQDASGMLTGFDVDFARALAKRLGAEAQFEPTPVAGLMGGLDAGRIDVVISQIVITPERMARYSFSQPYTVSGLQIIVLKDRADITGAADLIDKTVGVVGVGPGAGDESWLRTNVPRAKVRAYDDDAAKYADLEAGRVDAVLGDRMAALDLIKRSGAPLKAVGPAFIQQKRGVAFKPDAPLKTAIDNAIDAMRTDGRLTGLSQTWFGMDVTQ